MPGNGLRLGHGPTVYRWQRVMLAAAAVPHSGHRSGECRQVVPTADAQTAAAAAMGRAGGGLPTTAAHLNGGRRSELQSPETDGQRRHRCGRLTRSDGVPTSWKKPVDTTLGCRRGKRPLSARLGRSRNRAAVEEGHRNPFQLCHPRCRTTASGDPTSGRCSIRTEIDSTVRSSVSVFDCHASMSLGRSMTAGGTVGHPRTTLICKLSSSLPKSPTVRHRQGTIQTLCLDVPALKPSRRTDDVGPVLASGVQDERPQ